MNRMSCKKCVRLIKKLSLNNFKFKYQFVLSLGPRRRWPGTVCPSPLVRYCIESQVFTSHSLSHSLHRCFTHTHISHTLHIHLIDASLYLKVTICWLLQHLLLQLSSYSDTSVSRLLTLLLHKC